MTVMHRDLFYHRTWDRVEEALVAHDTIKLYNGDKKQYEKVIHYAKFLYRECLEEVMKGECNFDLTDHDKRVWVKESHRRSDFDWKNYELFTKFFDWIKEEQKQRDS